MKRKEVEIRLTNKDINYCHHQLKKDNFYIRIRDDAEIITMTVKTNLKKKYVDEYEININDFDEADKILRLLGCKKHYEIHML